MIAAVRRTWILVAILAVLVLVDVLAGTGVRLVRTELPELPAVQIDQVTKVQLTFGDERVVFEPDGVDGWNLSSPLQFKADRASVRAMLTAFREPVPMSVRLGDEDLDQYGLDGADTVLVEAFHGQDRLTAFYVGRNATEGSTFVRLPDHDDVYRARIGGRARYARPVSAWRDHMVVGVHPDNIVRIAMTSGHGRVQLERQQTTADDGSPTNGAWEGRAGPLAPAAGPDAGLVPFEVDQVTVTELAQSLANLRAGEILSPTYPAGLELPVAHTELELATGEAHRLTFGVTEEGAFARIDDREEVFRIARSMADKIARPGAAWADRALMRFDRSKVHQMRLIDGANRYVLEQDPTNSNWTMVEPRNVDVTLQEANGAARILGNLQAAALAQITPEQAGFPGPSRFEVELVGGVTLSLEIGGAVPGQTGQDRAVFVRTADQPDRIAVLPLTLIAALRKAWAR